MIVIVGLDGGNNAVKLFGENGEMMFSSKLGEYRERKLEQSFSDEDMIFEFNERKGFAGTLAEYESQFSASRMGDSKAHEDFLIRVLLGLHRYSVNCDFRIIVGQPIAKHTANEKKKMKQMLEGSHVMTLNGDTKKINIIQAEVAAECGSAFWSNPKSGKIRLLDIGSGTVNGATLIEGKYVDRDSFTMKDGLETTLTDDIFSFARAVALRALKLWDVDDEVYLVGGGAEQVHEALSDYFSNVNILRPTIQTKNGNKTSVKKLSPVFANAVGFYNIGRKVFKDEKED